LNIDVDVSNEVLCMKGGFRRLSAAKTAKEEIQECTDSDAGSRYIDSR